MGEMPMEARPKPVEKKGTRNIYCPFYRKCLDVAAKEKWPSWDCLTCPSKEKVQSISIINTDYDYIQYHRLPQRIIKQIQ